MVIQFAKKDHIIGNTFLFVTHQNLIKVFQLIQSDLKMSDVVKEEITSVTNKEDSFNDKMDAFFARYELICV
jgi:hypothetical protein